MAKKATIELGLNQLAYGIRAFDHLADAYIPGMSSRDPQVAAHKAVVTVLRRMSKLFSKEMSKPKANKPKIRNR